jgi:glucan phosphoethanolaminetransferase (alkaline phosphatase superfamily)
MDDISGRLLNVGVIISMIGAGLAYGWFLWSLNIRPNLSLFLTAIAPGATFLCVVWSIRAMQGVASAIYAAMLIDWLIFSCTGVLAVLAARRLRARP